MSNTRFLSKKNRTKPYNRNRRPFFKVEVDEEESETVNTDNNFEQNKEIKKEVSFESEEESNDTTPTPEKVSSQFEEESNISTLNLLESIGSSFGEEVQEEEKNQEESENLNKSAKEEISRLKTENIDVLATDNKIIELQSHIEKDEQPKKKEKDKIQENHNISGSGTDEEIKTNGDSVNDAKKRYRRKSVYVFFGTNLEKLKKFISVDGSATDKEDTSKIVLLPNMIHDTNREKIFSFMKNLGFKRYDEIFYCDIKFVTTTEVLFTRTKNKIRLLKSADSTVMSTADISDGYSKRHELNEEIPNIFSKEEKVILACDTHINQYENSKINIRGFKDAWNERGYFIVRGTLNRHFRFYFKGLKCTSYKKEKHGLIVSFE
jgi:hypothetical protein